jgi:hypothetical protein
MLSFCQWLRRSSSKIQQVLVFAIAQSPKRVENLTKSIHISTVFQVLESSSLYPYFVSIVFSTRCLWTNEERSYETHVYSPVRHSARNYLVIANGPSSFLQGQGNSKHINGHTQMLKRVCSHRSLEESCSLRTYIVCGVSRGKAFLKLLFEL